MATKARDPKKTSRKRDAAEPAEVITDVLTVFVGDRSGSMGGVRDATIEGRNAYVRDLQEDEAGRTWYIEIGFDDRIEIWQDGIDVKEVPMWDRNIYVPRGYTALNDAIATGIRRAEDKLAQLKGEGITAKVLLVVLTDGLENHSVEFPSPGTVWTTRGQRPLPNEALKAMVQAKQDQGNFTFVYLSADPNETPEQVAETYSVPVGNYASFSTDAVSVAHAGVGVQNVTRSLRSSKGMTTNSAFADAGEEQDYRTVDTPQGRGAKPKEDETD